MAVYNNGLDAVPSVYFTLYYLFKTSFNYLSLIYRVLFFHFIFKFYSIVCTYLPICFFFLPVAVQCCRCFRTLGRKLGGGPGAKLTSVVQAANTRKIGKKISISLVKVQ